MDGVFDFIGISMSFFLLFPFFYSIKKGIETSFYEKIKKHTNSEVEKAMEMIIETIGESKRTVKNEEEKVDALESFRAVIDNNLNGRINVAYLSNAFSVASICLFFSLVLYVGIVIANGSIEISYSFLPYRLSDGWNYMGNFFFIPMLLVIGGAIAMICYLLNKNFSAVEAEIFQSNGMFENTVKLGMVKRGVYNYYIGITILVISMIVLHPYCSPFFVIFFALMIMISIMLTFKTYRLAITGVIKKICED